MTIKVFDNESLLSFDAFGVDDLHTKICISPLFMPPQLSVEEKSYTLNYLANSME